MEIKELESCYINYANQTLYVKSVESIFPEKICDAVM